MKKRYDLTTPIKTASGDTFWHRVGAAWFDPDKDQISMEFNSLPLPNEEGKVRVMGFPPKEDGTDEAAGLRIQAYYFSAMQALTKEGAKPVYVSFSTRSWKSPKKLGESDADFAKREAMVIENWHGAAKAPDNGKFNPAAGVIVAGTRNVVPARPVPAISR